MATETKGWRIEQSSEVIGTHVIEFDDDNFQILNPQTGLEFIYDGAAGKLYLLDKEQRRYCLLDKNHVGGIPAYHFSNLSFGTFYDYRFAKDGYEKSGQYRLAKYAGVEKNPVSKADIGKVCLTVLLFQPAKYPPALASCVCYLYALPRLPGVPVKVAYAREKTAVGRLKTTSIKQTHVMLSKGPPSGWKQVKSPSEMITRDARVEFSDLLGPNSK